MGGVCFTTPHAFVKLPDGGWDARAVGITVDIINNDTGNTRLYLPIISIHNPAKLDSIIQLWQEFPDFTGQPALSKYRGFLQGTQYLSRMTLSSLPGNQMSSNGPFPW
jgi:hypothetical protein